MDDKTLKSSFQTPNPCENIELANTVAVGKKQGTRQDKDDMARMGKAQVLGRQFKFLSIFGYAVVLGNTWEYALIGVGIALHNGGPAGGIWTYIAVSLGMCCVTSSFAEMASMAPACGGQYHWVSEIAPKNHQRFVSYVVGWLCVIEWQVAMAATAFAAAQQVQALIALNMPSYNLPGWHGTLLSIAVTMLSIVWNTILATKLPLIEGFALCIHFFGFFAFLVVLWVMGPRSSTKDVWTKFENPSGWGSNGLATLVGIIGPILALGGADTACHLAEEVKDSAKTTPRAMVATSIVNYSLGFVMTVTVFSTLGDDPNAILDTSFGQPWVQIMYNATESTVATSVMTAVVGLMLLFCSVNQITCSSRQLFSFARDKGLPCSAWLSHVPPGRKIPVNAVMFTLFTTSLLCLIITGSAMAFNILISVANVSLYSSYIIVIGYMLRKRISGEALLPSSFSLGRAGFVVNMIALCYLLVAVSFMFFPTRPNPSLIDMNWASVIFMFMVVLSMVYYYLHGKHHYEGPVVSVKQS